MNIEVYVGIWTALGLVVLVLAIYRNLLGIHETTLHVSRSGASAAARQKQEFHKEEMIERWGQRLTIIVVAYGLILAAVYLYRVSEYGSLMNR